MKQIILILLTFLTFYGSAQKPVRLSSPDGNLVFSLAIIKGQAIYKVSFKTIPVIDNSLLGVSFQDGKFLNDLTLGKAIYRDAEEKYELVSGKTRQVDEHFKEVVVPIRQGVQNGRTVNLAIRAFNDGVAFRYEFPLEGSKKDFVLTDEHTTFHFSGDPIVRALLLPNYTSSHEGPYTVTPLSQLQQDTLMDMPALFEVAHGAVFVGITESALLDYAGIYLMKQNGVLTTKLSPLPGQSEIKVKASLPHHSPWRVLMISDRVGALIESNIVTNLSEPCRIKDLGWLKPGKTTFPWWNGNVVPDSINAPGNNFVTNKYYIDFCARNGIEYHSVVEYGLHEWYTNDGAGFAPGPHADVTKPVPGLDMQEVCDYAKSVGVGVRVWVYWTALYKKLDSAFAQFEKWGLKGMMVDFMDRDDQEMVNIQTEILEKAAAHHLHIQFHGADKPTGLNRTYPNEFTREGTMNYEVDKWDKRVTPDHDINIPFTRMLAGSTDYHLGGFRAVPDSLFKIQYTRPLLMGTRCHMLAMYVVLENYLGMVCDYPAAYEGQPGFEFLKEVPTVWEETKVPVAKPGEYIVIARKNKGNWFAGGITNHSQRDLSIPLSFLGEGNFNAEIFTDAPDAATTPDHLVKNSKPVTAKSSLNLHLAGGGGFAIKFTKL